jgi:hypothetical protein
LSYLWILLPLSNEPIYEGSINDLDQTIVFLNSNYEFIKTEIDTTYSSYHKIGEKDGGNIFQSYPDTIIHQYYNYKASDGIISLELNNQEKYNFIIFTFLKYDE